jgi:hypothetical protein
LENNLVQETEISRRSMIVAVFAHGKQETGWRTILNLMEAIPITSATFHVETGSCIARATNSINSLTSSGNYTSHLLQQSVTPHFVFMSFL